jgi:DNA-binding winged helix-turn-helix (wHTH) protein
MPEPPPSPDTKILRFGIFEADLHSHELRKNGARIRLQEQPFQVLAALLQRSGQICTREELRQSIWPADTFVDFDHSLNTAINKLREALGDSATHPRFIETVARKGYRFIAPVRQAQSEPPNTVNASHSPASPSTGKSVISEHGDLDLPRPHRAVPRALFAVIQIMYLVFYLVALFHLPGIDSVVGSFVSNQLTIAVLATVMVTAGIGIPLRCYLVSAIAFDYGQLGLKFHRLFWLILPMDFLWALAPFLLAGKIGLGASFAATAALLYVPFSQRTLVRMAYAGNAVVVRAVR